jgi:hypothetical protein
MVFAFLSVHDSTLPVRARHTLNLYFTTAERGRNYAPQRAATAVVGAQHPVLPTKLPQAPALLPSIPGLSSVCVSVCKTAPLLRGILER